MDFVPDLAYEQRVEVRAEFNVAMTEELNLESTCLGGSIAWRFKRDLPKLCIK